MVFEIICIILIAAFQTYIYFCKTRPSIRNYSSIFTYGRDGEKLSLVKGVRIKEKVRRYNDITCVFEDVEVERVLNKNISQIKTEYTDNNGAFETIIDSINNYLKENPKRVSDYALIKDIVNRNVNAAEDDVRELLPIPLYCGLAGTMLGIIIGVFTLVKTLPYMLGADGVSANSLSPFLTDVAIAMICSLLGVFYTTLGTLFLRKEKEHVEKGKDNFLSWIQVNLLPEMPDNVSSVMRQITGDLKDFNQSFEQNSKQLSQVLGNIKDTASSNVELIKAVRELNQVETTTANIQLYNRLASCTREIGTLANYLENCSSYLEQVRALNTKLDDSEGRMKMLEDMAFYFKEERSRIEKLSDKVVDTVGHADESLRQSTEQFRINIEQYFTNLQESLVRQTNEMEKAFVEQQTALSKKAGEVSQLVSELKNLQDVKKTMKELVGAYQYQSELLQKLLSSLGKSEKVTIQMDTKPVKLPSWLSVIIIVVFLLIVVMTFLFLNANFNWFKL